MPNFLSSIFGSRPQYQNVTNPTAAGSAYSQLNKINPGNPGQITQGSADISSFLSGQLPKSVSDQIVNLGALYGLNTGMPGSGNAQDYTLENLGLNSLNVEQQGIGDYLNFAGGLQGMYTLNPEGTAAIDQAQAAPDPRAAGLEQWLASMGGELMGAGTSLGSSVI